MAKGAVDLHDRVMVFSLFPTCAFLCVMAKQKDFKLQKIWFSRKFWKSKLKLTPYSHRYVMLQLDCAWRENKRNNLELRFAILELLAWTNTDFS